MGPREKWDENQKNKGVHCRVFGIPVVRRVDEEVVLLLTSPAFDG